MWNVAVYLFLRVSVASMKLLIFVHHPFDQWNAPDWFPKRLSQEFPQVNVVHLPDYTRVDGEIVDAEIAIAWSIRPGQIAAAKKLRWIHSPAAGGGGARYCAHLCAG